MTRVVASIEARMGASRLPGKVLADLAGRPALGRMIDRVRLARRIDDIVVATSVATADDRIEALAVGEGVACYRGSEADVLDRVVRAQEMMNADVVVELCGDCPLIDPEVIDRAVERFMAGDCDVVTTTAPQSYPQGLDVEVFTLAALETVAASDPDDEVREHVSLAFYRDPARYRIVNLEAPPALARPGLRLLLDYPQDLLFLSGVCAALDRSHGPRFSIAELLVLIDREELAPFAPGGRDGAAGAEVRRQ